MKFKIILLFCILLSCGNPTGPITHLNPTNNTGKVQDADGNIYDTIRIGNQTWTIQNLRTTHYNDGTPIQHNTNSFSSSIPTYCFYNNTTNGDSITKFGALYTWYAVNTGKLAPKGWHVPSNSEWIILQQYLGLNGFNWGGSIDTTPPHQIAKALCAKTDWAPWKLSIGTPGNDLTTNNKSGFSALPGGYQNSIGFWSIGHEGDWWCSDEHDSTNPYDYQLQNTSPNLFQSWGSSTDGASVRLIKDN